MKEKIEAIKIEKEFTKEELNEIKKKIIKYQEGSFSSREWFLIIKPIGQKYHQEIKNYLAQKGIDTIKEIKTNSWRELALPLYIKNIDDPYFEYVLYRNEFFKTIEGEGATILYLRGIVDKETIYQIKKEMRKIFTLPNVVMIIPHIKTEKIMEPNAFHIPDEEDLEKEHRVLYNILKKEGNY